MKKKDFLAEVMNEIEIIKIKATPSEIGRLNINDFSHASPSRCIYGQMTGECSSKRAKELTPKVYDIIGGDIFETYTPFTKQIMTKRHGWASFTPLEKYLYMVRKPMHTKIIAYLKGDTDTLKLS
jgi:hypothetical protein